jgi:hypothetical protein
MMDSMLLMTIENINGHWKTKDGRCYLVIDMNHSRVTLFVDQSLYIDEPLSFDYINVGEERNLCNV